MCDFVSLKGTVQERIESEALEIASRNTGIPKYQIKYAVSNSIFAQNLTYLFCLCCKECDMC